MTTAAPHVLVVEDSPTQRSLLQRQLGEEGFRVSAAGCGTEGLAQARKLNPDVVVLDLAMPGLDGHGVLEALRTDPKLGSLPVVVLTQTTAGMEVARTLVAGADDYVRKPYELPELTARLRVALKKANTVASLRERTDELTQETRIDPLTGLANRRAIDQELERLEAGARRHGRDLIVAAIDVDNFKSVNDASGHQAGDKALRAVAQAIAAAIRGTDLAGRFGGDEFVALLPDCTRAEAPVVAERIRAGVAQDTPVTVSVGWAAWNGETPAALMARADVALYAAKVSGRDTIRGAPAHAARQ